MTVYFRVHKHKKRKQEINGYLLKEYAVLGWSLLLSIGTQFHNDALNYIWCAYILMNTEKIKND